MVIISIYILYRVLLYPVNIISLGIVFGLTLYNISPFIQMCFSKNVFSILASHTSVFASVSGGTLLLGFEVEESYRT